jgi:RNA-directed DNA polymerase
MKESCGEGLATHADPESCGAVCKDRVEALTGARAGRVYSRESRFLRDADAVGESGRLHQAHRYRERRLSPARSETPCTYGHTSCGSREVPCSPVTVGVAGRVGKSKDVRRR